MVAGNLHFNRYFSEVEHPVDVYGSVMSLLSLVSSPPRPPNNVEMRAMDGNKKFIWSDLT